MGALSVVSVFAVSSMTILLSDNVSIASNLSLCLQLVTNNIPRYNKEEKCAQRLQKKTFKLLSRQKNFFTWKKQQLKSEYSRARNSKSYSSGVNCLLSECMKFI